MSRFTPAAVTSEYAAITSINTNFTAIAALLDEMLARNGDGTNSMLTDLDMNHFKVKNLASAIDPTDAVNLGQTIALVDAVTATIKATEVITPQKFGAVADGVTDDYPAFAAALAYLEAFALNNGSIYYNGSPRLFIPAGKYRSSSAIDVTHTVIIEGEGSGQFGPGSFGCSHIKFDAATDGIRFQAANTSGNTTIDNPIHNGSGGAVIRDLCLEGGFNGTTESDHHGLVIRNAIKAERLYIKNFPGEGVKAWAGIIDSAGGVDYSGNVSSTMLVSVKTEGCRGGIDIRGRDANVITTINCEGYQNRLFGLLDDNGAGSNTHIGVHCASNGVVFGTWAQTQCSYSGNYYALKWGGDPTVAPSGTTADTANWFYIIAGAPIANLIPAWVNTPNTFRAGGDYLTLNSAGVLIDNCYSETGGFNQFSANTIINHGSITDAYYRGGTRLNPNNGYRISQSPDINLTLQHSSTQGAILVEDAAGVTHSSIILSKTLGNYHKARDISGHVFQTAPYNGSSTIRASITTNGLELPASHAVLVNSLQVVGARQTGWTADTGTAKKTANATYAAGTTLTYSAAYVQAEQTAMATRVAALELIIQANSQTIKGLKDSLIAHGIIGT